MENESAKGVRHIGDRVVLAEPVLVAMRPKERADAVRLLAALMLAARPGSAARHRDEVLNSSLAEALPMAEVTNGNPQTDDEPGEAA